MRIAYFDCSTGISGDMTLAALIDAGVDVGAVSAAVQSLGLPGVELRVQTVRKKGFRATQVHVEHSERQPHRHLHDVLELINRSQLTPRQKDLASRIFRRLAQAEAHVHGQPVERVHFHEVGAVDSIVDVVGAAVGLDLLNVDRFVASPVPTGRGFVRIAHGVCSVPAPGTAELLKGVPLADVPVEAELTTPTGAAILTTVVDQFGPLPAMTVEAIGYGAGSRDLPDRANVLRLFVGRLQEPGEVDQVCVLETNLDDVSGEVVGYTKRRLFEAGALDVYTTPIQMKKDRPGVVLTVLCRPADAVRLEQILFDETATFGVRRWLVERTKRRRREHVVQTPFGPVRGKLGWTGRSSPVFVPEFESCREVAERHGVSLREVYRAAEAAFDPKSVEEGSRETEAGPERP